MVEIYLFNKISEDAAIALLRAQTDEFMALSIGRTNFRPTDDSSVYNNANPNKYIRRLYSDGVRAVNFIKIKNLYSLVHLIMPSQEQKFFLRHLGKN